MSENSPIQIQIATLKDFNSVRSLEKDCFDQDAWPLLDILSVLSLPGIIRLRAEMEDHLAGFIAADYHDSQNRAWILTLGVFRQYRRMGIARRLLCECERRIERPVVRLTVRAGNEPAIYLYRSEGYEQVDEWKGYYAQGEDGLVFEKRLHSS